MQITTQPPPPNQDAERYGRPESGWRLTLYKIIFESDTQAGRTFDLILIGFILTSVVTVALDSVASIHTRHDNVFRAIEWFFTLVFTAEYLCRLACVKRPLRYARSAFGIIDLLALLPTYVAVLVPGVYALVDVRVLRLLRIFRILKLSQYVAEYSALAEALSASRRKIAVFMSFVLLVVVVMGTLMYVVEGPQHGFTSIPVGIYWAITTMTTVGFGDIAPKTAIGRGIASAMMLLGWGTLAVPTGIVSSEFTAQRARWALGMKKCEACGTDRHPANARFCSDCGAPLPPV
ncbi:ion transporter [Xylophilus sp. GOD-11R]|uniref:ion transporter n=1 Tax=Xylophilus sp. GOD-11R TaxID=3089814 RepID=UPI00298CA379|nr:ion transporter [Xylophilus sp. GOD-11R]WPB55641.1 ion transporter [Xylophilus sp. GOD-11R]